MIAQHTIHYELASADDLSQLVDEIVEVSATTIIVAFDESDSWSATDVQLARLVAAARTTGKQLIAERRSGSVADRAMMLGFQDSAVATDAPSLHSQETTAIKSPSENPTAVIAPPDRFVSTANLATYQPLAREVTFTWRGTGYEVAPSPTSPTDHKRQPVSWRPESNRTPIHGPPLTVDQSISATALTAHAQPGVIPKPSRGPVPIAHDDADSDGINGFPSHARVRRRRPEALKLAAAIFAPLIFIGIVGALAAYLLPSATVTLVPIEEPISSSLTYGVASADAVFDITIEPVPLSSTSTAVATRESIGERFVPAGTAGGVLQITNPLTNEVTVPAGTEIPGANGVTYYTVEDVLLPAADPYGSLAFGSATVSVYAGVVGPDGNISAGALTGQLGNNMFYTNPEGIGGGRMDRYAVITEEDVNAVREQVTSELNELARDEFMAALPEGREIVPGTFESGEPEIEVSAYAGDDGEHVSASGSVTVRAQVYDPAELHELAGREADRLLARQGGGDRILLAETVAIQEPTDLEGEIPAFQIEIEAMARKVITEAEKTAIIEALAGGSRSEAEELLGAHPKVERFQIDLESSWLLDRMPRIASRISVHVSSGEQTASTR